jgi:hypothetical protein
MQFFSASQHKITNDQFIYCSQSATGHVPIRIKLSATNLGQLLADEMADIRKSVQIRHLPRNQLPRREPLSLLFEQPSHAGQHAPEQASELPVKEGFQQPPATHEPLAGFAKGQLPLLGYGLGGSQRQQALHQDNDQPSIDKAKNAFWPGVFQDIDLEQRFPVLENQLDTPS